VDDIEHAAIAAQGYDPDDPAALARVSALLAELGRRGLPVHDLDR
jgi:hypothetical protein